MKRHTLVCPPGFVEQFGKCVPEGNRPDGTRADLVSGDVVPFVPDNVPDGGGGGDDGYDYGGLFDKASKALRYAGMSKKIYDSQQSLEEEMRRYQLGAGEAEEGTEVIMFRGPEEAPLTTEELRLRALAKQYDDVPMEPTKSKTQIKYEEDLDRILKRPNAPPDTPPTQEEIDKIIKARKKTTFIPSEDPDAKLLNEIAERQAAPVDEGIPADIPTLESLSGNKSGVGKNPFPDPAGQYGGVRPPLDELPPDVPSRPPTFAPLDELPPDVPVAGYGPEFTDLHSAIVERGTKSVAAEAAEVEAKEAIAAARAGGTAVSVAQEADILRTITAAAQAGEDADVAALIMGGLVEGGVASVGAVAAVGVEIAALTALNYGAEYALKKAGVGLPDRPESLNQGAHAATPEEIAYFKALNKNELDTFNSSDLREKAGYDQMSAQEQKKFDNGLIKQKKELGRNVDSWDGVGDGMVIQPNPSGGFQFIDPSAKREPNPEWLKDFQEQIGAAPAQESSPTTDSVAASQGLKVGGGSVA